MKQKLLSITILFCAFSIQAFSQNKYYVATAAQGGNDTNAGTSLAAPFATIAKALTSATIAGDSIFVRSGTYTVSITVRITRAGTAAKHFVLTAYKPDLVDANSRPVFDFSSMAASSSNRGFNLSNANYWDIYGIVVRGAGDNGMNMDNSSYSTIEFCSFLRNRDTGLQIGNLSHNVNVINCDSYENADLGAGTTTNGGNADGFSPKLDVGDTIVFRGCRAWMNSDDGWDGYLRTTNNVTAFLEDCWAFRNGYYWLDNSTTTDQNGNGFKLGGSDNKDLAHNFVVIKCLAFQNKARGFDQNNSGGSLYLYNNSAYQNKGNDYGLNSSGVVYKAGAELVLKNNMSLGSLGVNIQAASTSARSVTSVTNSFSTATTSTQILSFDTTGVTGMRSVDGSLPNLNFMRLNTAAPTPYTYIDKGTVLSEVTYRGAVGVPYNGTAPDLGYSESSNGAFPVKMLSFAAFSNTSGVTLNWKIATETNNKGWSIERSTVGNDASWIDLGFVKGQSSSSSLNNYAYFDNNVLPGTYYYRLKQTDLDGNITYSTTILVKIENGKRTTKIEVYPNPFKSAATFRYSIPANAKVSLAIYNQQGQLVNKLVEEEQQAGTYQKLINGQNLPAGKYYLKLLVGDKTVTGSVIKE